MATGKPNSVETTKPILRKRRTRRTASLVAEALWNIQMEEDVSGKIGVTRKSASQTLETALEVATTETRWTNSKKRKRCGSTLSRKNAKACVHLPARSGKVSHTMAVEKPMASVVPVVKLESSPPNCAEKRQINGASAGNSQVLLLPISLNPGVSAGVPILALRPASVNADFMSCFNASTLVNVGPILTGSNVCHAQQSIHESHSCQMRHLESPEAATVCTFRGNQAEVVDQIEPLNLKLGESSIPSGEFHYFARKVPAGKGLGNSLLFRQEERTSRILSTCINHPHRVRKNGSSVTSKISKDVLCIQANETSTFVAYSPSSESSTSTDPDDASVTLKKPRRRRKVNISLRSKAASSPAETEPCGTSNRKSVSSDNNGWIWDGEAYNAFVYSVETGEPVIRRCYPSMRRKSESRSKTSETGEDNPDDVVMVRDCVIMRADGDEQPYVAKIAALWQEPFTGKMMISLLWFYRPEHTEDVRVLNYHYNDDELFASRHLDEISVECVEDKCYVLTYNQYCRYVATSERMEEHVGAINRRDLVPTLLRPRDEIHTILPSVTDRSLVYFCRKFYDIKSHRLLKTFPPPTTLFYANSRNQSS